MNRSKRQVLVADLIVANGSITVDELVDRFGVSPATARRDLDQLAHQQFIVRTHGGAVLAPSTGELPLRYRTARYDDEKKRIASKAVSMLAPGDVVAMNGGTTTTALAQELGARVASDPRFGAGSITVVTNAVNIAFDLSVREEVQVVVTGGVARSRSYELIGPLTRMILPEIDIHTLFLGLDAVNVNTGAFTVNDEEAAIGSALVKAATRVIATADHTKFSARAFARICALNQLDTIITDEGLDPGVRASFEAAGVEIVLA